LTVPCAKRNKARNSQTMFSKTVARQPAPDISCRLVSLPVAQIIEKKAKLLKTDKARRVYLQDFVAVVDRRSAHTLLLPELHSATSETAAIV
jgi:hypothetical protein